jgi:hypothetical protein
MTNSSNDERAAQAPAQAHPTPWSRTFGDLDDDVPVFQDQPQEPTARSSAARLAALRQQRDRASQEHREKTRLARHAAQAQEDEALEKYTRQVNSGQTPDQGTRIMAARALERQGGSGLSTAQQLAGPTLARFRREQQDQADTDEQRRRRQGRRPRR